MPRLLTAAVVAACAAPALAQVYMADSFDTPGATPGNDADDPRDIGYHAMPGAPAFEVRQVEGRGGVLASSLSASTSDRDIYASSSFSPAVLSPGHSVTLGFSIRAIAGTGPGGTDIPVFAFGLHDGKGTNVTDSSPGSVAASLDDQGYHLYLLGTERLQSSMQKDFGGERLDVEAGRPIPAFNYADGEWHDYELVLRDEGQSMFISVDLYIDGVLHFSDDFTQRGVFSFDTLHFGLVQGAMEMELDDIYVRGPVVPAPGPLAVLLPTLAAAGARRRRR